MQTAGFPGGLCVLDRPFTPYRFHEIFVKNFSAIILFFLIKDVSLHHNSREHLSLI